MLKCVADAEEILKRPPTFVEVYVIIKKRYPSLPIPTPVQSSAVIASLVREDWLYIDETAQRVTLNKREGFLTFSQIFRQKYGSGFSVDRIGTLVTSP